MSRGALAALLIAALGAGLGAWLWMSDDPAPSRQTSTKASRARPADKATPQALPPDADIEDRVALLERQVAELQRDNAKLKLVKSPAVARGFADDNEEPRDDSPVFEGAVRDIIEADRAEATERRTDAMRERFSERREETLDELVAATGINATQRESISELWDAESEQLIPLFVAAREGERPFREVREEIEKVRESTDVSIEDMLDAAQFETYKEMRPGPPRGGRGGRRGGPPPP